MNYLYPYFKPVLDLWSHFVEDPEYEEYIQSKQEWHIKTRQWQSITYNKGFKREWNRLYEIPTWSEFLENNIYRITLLAGLERLVTLRQAQHYLKNKHAFFPSTGSAIETFRNDGGLTRGYFKGNFLNIFSTLLVQFHAYKSSEGSLKSFMLYLMAYETLWYPIDTLKTMMYADNNNQFKNLKDCVSQTLNRGGIGKLYSGLFSKLGFNGLLGLHLWGLSQNNDWLYYGTLAAYLGFGAPLLSLKTTSQVIGSPLSFHDMKTSYAGMRPYAGFLPLVILNLVAMYQFPVFWANERKEKVLDEYLEHAPAQRVAGKEVWS
jgi:hypothetical protein